MAAAGAVTMIVGFGGRLISELFLESRVDPSDARAALVARRMADWRRAAARFGPASGVRALLDGSAAPLLEALGLTRPSNARTVGDVMVATAGGPTTGGSTGPVLQERGSPVTIVVAPFAAPLDPLWRTAVVEAIRRRTSWALLFNGVSLRIVDAARTYARRYAGFELDLAAADPRATAALALLIHGAFADGAGGTTKLHALVAESDRHAAGVCRSLRFGVLAASADLLDALAGRTGRVPLADAFEQSLTIVYRLLFLLFAEARALVPLWHPVYRRSYSVEALRVAAEHPRQAAGLWDALNAMARLAHAGCRAGDLRVTPFNGRLFAPSATSLAARRGLDDEAARRAVLALSTRPAPGGGRERISYRDLGVDQLGAVYETLLDYQPQPTPRAAAGGRGTRRVRLERGSGVRKATGSFYTPEPIATYLVRRTLGPLVRGATPERILALRVVDPAMGSGAFLVAACRFLAAACEDALVESGACHRTDMDAAARASIRRSVAERCLYGVDSNPMAVQLARLSLWLTTLAADRPLTFLDHHLRVGDSLLGASLPHLSYPPRLGARRAQPAALPLFGDEAVERVVCPLIPIRLLLERTPDDTIQQVRAKERALAELNRRDAPLSDWKRVADAWCAPWFAGGSASGSAMPARAFTSLADAVLAGRGALPATATETYLRRAAEIGLRRRFFHWELEFPEVFFDESGRRSGGAGFDAVLGNPPWDMVRADGGSRKEAAAVLRFTRDSGLYTAQSAGHANRYQLFAERAVALTRHGGRIGLVLPSGLATDHGSAALRRRLLAHSDVDGIVGLDNARGVFPIHRSVRFLLITASVGSPTRSIRCRLGERDPGALAAAGDEARDEDWYPLRLTPALIEKISGDGLAIPDLRTPLDLSIVERAASLFPPLGSDAGWAVRFGRELNATDDRDHLRERGPGLPVVEGRHLQPFCADIASATLSIGEQVAARLLPAHGFARRRLAYRDVASATNRQTLIAAVLPARCVSIHTVFCLRTRLAPADQHLLCGLFNSFVVNYLVRLRVTTHVTTAVVERLPMPRREDAPGGCRRIAALARMLARRRAPDAAARLNALVARLYQLTPDEFRHVLGTFPLVPAVEREAALAAYRSLPAPRGPSGGAGHA